MRKRLNLLFVLLVLALASTGYLARTWSVQRAVRAHDDALLKRGATAIALVVDERERAGRHVGPSALRGLVGPDLGLRVHPATGPDVTLRGPGFGGALHPADDGPDLWATVDTADGGYVVLGEDSSAVRDTVWQRAPTMIGLLVLVALLAALAGMLLGRWYEAPFRRLARAAAALGRGRFQLDLPRSRVPAAEEIARALDASARQLQERLAGEDAFAQQASHALRTPLTGLRLELEEVVLEDDLPPAAAAALERSLVRVDQLDAVAGELVDTARGRALVAQAAIPLDRIAHQVTEHWANELGMRNRQLSTAVEGDGRTTYTPGPVEQILEFLLVDVVYRSAGTARLVFAVGGEGHLRITVTAAAPVAVRKNGTAPLARARTIAIALGGVLEGEYADGGVEIVLPRR